MTTNYYTPRDLAREFGVSDKTARRAFHLAVSRTDNRHEGGQWWRFDLSDERDRATVEAARQCLKSGRCSIYFKPRDLMREFGVSAEVARQAFIAAARKTGAPFPVGGNHWRLDPRKPLDGAAIEHARKSLAYRIELKKTRKAKRARRAKVRAELG